MPNLPTHIHFSLASTTLTDAFTTKSQTAAFILGSTTPDIRAITKKNRSIYHFVDLDFGEVGEGLENLINKHGDLIKITAADPEMTAFMAVSYTHLTLPTIYSV